MEDQALFDRLFNNTACLDNGCIKWLGGCAPNGYGKIKYKGQTLSTHRVSFQLCKGEIPDKLWILHSCDYRPCINPKHLFLGDAKINKHDSMQKDRHAYGESHGNSKLSCEDVQNIRELLREETLTQEMIAQRFGVTQPTINWIKFNRHWNWLGEVNIQ